MREIDIINETRKKLKKSINCCNKVKGIIIYMKIKRISLSVLAIVLVIAFAAGCGGGSTQQGSAPQGGGGDTGIGPPVHFKLGHSLPDQDYRGMGANYFAEKVEELSGGNMTVTVFPSETLTTAQNMIQLVSSGAAEIGTGTLSFAASVAPDLGVLDIPGTYDPRYFRETYEQIRDIIDEILEPHGVKMLIMYDESDSVFYINKAKATRVQSPADIADLRIRDHGLWIGRTISAWGSNPMTVVPGELAVALERGTVDGGYTGWGIVNAFRLYELTPIITFGNMSKSAWSPATINLDLWNSLTQAQRDVLTEASRLTEVYTDEILADAFETFSQNVKDAGGEFYEMTPAETAEFIRLAEPVIDQFRSEANEIGLRLLEKMLEVKASFG